jgi:hypothetical protein
VANDGHAHDWSAEFDRRAWRWLENMREEAGESTMIETTMEDRQGSGQRRIRR